MAIQQLTMHKAYNGLTLSWTVLIVLLITLLSSATADIIVHTKNGTSIPLAARQIIYLRSTTEPIAESITLEATNKLDNISGKIFVMKNGPFNEREILKVQQNKAQAVIVLSAVLNVPGLMRFRWNDWDEIAQIQIPLFETTKASGVMLWNLIDEGKVDYITLLPDEGNPWDDVYPSTGYYIWTVFLMAFNATNIALAIWKIKLFADFYGGITLAMAFFVLFIEIISNLLRLVGLIDLFGANQIYPEQVAFAFTEQSFPFVISSMMLFTLYWHEMMTTSSVIVHPFIVKMRVPFFVISSSLIALSVIRNFLRAYTTISSLNFIMSGIWASVNLALVIFYVITGTKVLKRLKESKKSGRRAMNLRKSTIRILVSIGFIFLYCCIALLFAVDIIYFPWGLIVGWYLLYTVMNGASLMNIIAFMVPSGGSSGSSANRTKRSVQVHPPQTSQLTSDQESSTTDATGTAGSEPASIV